MWEWATESKGDLRWWTDSWRFLNRKEAMDLAKKNGQLKKLDEDWNPIDYSDRKELHSEDLR